MIPNGIGAFTWPTNWNHARNSDNDYKGIPTFKPQPRGCLLEYPLNFGLRNIEQEVQNLDGAIR